MTVKQASALVRKHLADATRRRLTFTPPDAEPFTLATPGLRFAVRATPTGKINVTIEDAGYVDRVTGGDRSAIDHQAHCVPVVEPILEYERLVWGEELGDVKWGPILVSATAWPVPS